ncbi:MAG: lysophospholipid acyltransferase family protein [Magnetospirillum gryphiswaldense]|nr:lysophospholipid acyltransferase family protein [Magnetospirillum gryphiswaldense]
MSLVKQLGKNETLRGFLCWLVSLYIRLVWVTSRWQVENAQVPQLYWDQGKPFILSFWHGRLIMMMKCWRSGVPVAMMTSQHRDGQLIARMSAHFGIGSVTGSTSRGGAGALRAMLKLLKAGEYVGITPDGPKGPRMRAADGIVILAKLSGCPIIPATCAASPRWLLKSWDRFQVPKPFGKGVFIWGEPIFVSRDASDEDVERVRQHLETVLNDLCDQADRMVGEQPVPPA